MNTQISTHPWEIPDRSYDFNAFLTTTFLSWLWRGFHKSHTKNRFIHSKPPFKCFKLLLTNTTISQHPLAAEDSHIFFANPPHPNLYALSTFHNMLIQTFDQKIMILCKFMISVFLLKKERNTHRRRAKKFGENSFREGAGWKFGFSSMSNKMTRNCSKWFFHHSKQILNFFSPFNGGTKGNILLG